MAFKEIINGSLSGELLPVALMKGKQRLIVVVVVVYCLSGCLVVNLFSRLPPTLRSCIARATVRQGDAIHHLVSFCLLTEG